MLWTPLALLAVVATLAASGIPLVPGANAGTDTTTVTVSATIAAAATITNGCTGALSLGASITPGTSATTGNCAINFSSSNNGTNIVLTAKRTGGTQTLCYGSAYPGTCATANFTDQSSTCAASVPSGQFGMAVPSTGGTNAPTNNWCATAGHYKGLTGSDQTVCTTATAAASSTCNVRFQANVPVAQKAGDYVGQVTFTNTAT